MQEPVRELDAMGEDGLLAFAGDCAETARRAEVDPARAAYQWAVLHAPEQLDPVESAKPDRGRPGSGAGQGPRRSPSSPPPRSGPDQRPRGQRAS